MPKKKQPLVKRSLDSKIDKLIGGNLLIIRKRRGFSQTAFAEKLGVSFQQVQKYETGTNRISASTLYMISEILNVNVVDFFAGLPGFHEKFDLSSEEIDVLNSYARINNPKAQESVRKIMKTLARSK